MILAFTLKVVPFVVGLCSTLAGMVIGIVIGKRLSK